MANPSTISGDAISDLCVVRAGMLNLNVYDTVPSQTTPEINAAIAANNANWEKHWSRKGKDGYRCDLYVPKQKGSDPKERLCPPILVFRGSDSTPEDIAELAVGMRLNGEVFVDKPWPASNQTIPFSVDKSAGLASNMNGLTLAQLDALGMHKEPLFTNVAGEENIDIAVDYYFDAEVSVRWNLTVALYYGTSGDWPVNFAQGLGREIPPQYRRAVEDGLEAAKLAKAEYNNRIIVSGHSLGGGLASAASIAMRAKNPDLIMRSDTFNAAGLHANTARMAGGTLNTAGDVPIRARYVKDEVLNSMQADSRLVPFLADVLDWGRKSMPAAVANPSPSPGKSPGAMSISGKTYAPKYGKLPILYTVDKQALGPKLTELGTIIGLANAANTITQFVASLIQHLVRRISQNGTLTKAEADALQAAIPQMSVGPDFAGQLANAVLADGPVPTVSLTGNAYITGHVQPLANTLIKDLVTVGKVLLASGEYHTFPPCAFTFLLKK